MSRLQFFLNAFSPDQYGKSMGRAAETALADFEKMTLEERQIATDYIYDVFSSNTQKIYGGVYILFVEKYGEERFIIPLEEHLDYLTIEKPTFRFEIESTRRAVKVIQNKTLSEKS